MHLLHFTIALGAALLAAMGVGGGGLLVIYLTLFLQMEQRAAQGVNLLFFLCASVSALFIHVKERRIQWQAVWIFALTGSAGAVLGCLLSESVDSLLLQRCFGYLLLFAGATTLWKTLRKKDDASQ